MKWMSLNWHLESVGSTTGFITHSKHRSCKTLFFKYFFFRGATGEGQIPAFNKVSTWVVGRNGRVRELSVKTDAWTMPRIRPHLWCFQMGFQCGLSVHILAAGRKWRVPHLVSPREISSWDSSTLINLLLLMRIYLNDILSSESLYRIIFTFIHFFPPGFWKEMLIFLNHFLMGTTYK